MSNARSGVILITVLWTVALLAALAMAASVSLRAFAGIVAVDRDRLQAEALFTAGLEVAAGIASAIGDGPLSDLETTVTLSQGTVHLRLEDEGGRIDIGKAPVDVLATLLRSVGVDDPDGIARQIVEWRKVDAGAAQPAAPLGAVAPTAGTAAGTPAPPTAGAPATSAGSLFTDVADLLHVPGMRPQWVSAIAPLATVFGNETVNPLSAPAPVLAALGMDENRLAVFLDARRLGVDAKQLVADLGGAQSHLEAKPPQAIGVHLSTRLGDGYATSVEAVIVCLPKDRQLYRVLAWKPGPPQSPP
jgi:general secretion pathway protein K